MAEYQGSTPRTNHVAALPETLAAPAGGRADVSRPSIVIPVVM